MGGGGQFTDKGATTKDRVFLHLLVARPHVLSCLAILLLIIMTTGGTAGAVDKNDSYDLIIKGGTIYDGTLTPPYRADVGIAGDKIIAVGKRTGGNGKNPEG
jgi:hypothetical protein